MILLSNIIKAEYVVFDNRINKQVNQTKKPEQPEPEVISTPREDLYEIYNQREIILKEASEEASRIVNAAKRNALTEIAECKKRGYEEGYNAGMEIGKNKGYAEGYEAAKINIIEELNTKNEVILKELADMMEKIEEEKEEIISRYEKGLSKLAVDIAEKIIRQKIETNSNVISGIIKNVIKDYRNSEWIKIYISGKDDVISVQADKELINELNKISNDVKFEISEDLEEGSVIVETPDNVVDASINTQLKNLKEMVLSKNAV
jgi:flagellar assembly protein FliH